MRAFRSAARVAELQAICDASGSAPALPDELAHDDDPEDADADADDEPVAAAAATAAGGAAAGGDGAGAGAGGEAAGEPAGPVCSGRLTESRNREST